MAVTSTLVDNVRVSNIGTSVTFSTTFGTAFTGRVIVIPILFLNGTVTAASIAGITAQRYSSASGLSFIAAVVPTGTSGTVSLTLSASGNVYSLGTFALTGADATWTSVYASTGLINGDALNIPAGGAVIVPAANLTGFGTWTNATGVLADSTSLPGAYLAAAKFDNAGGALTSYTINYSASSLMGAVIYSPSAASGDIAGTTSLTYTSTSTLKGKGKLSGPVNTSFSAAGLLKGKAVRSGTSTLIFGSSATGHLTVKIFGSSTLTFVQTSNLTGVGRLVGASSLAFSSTSGLAGTGYLHGTSNLDFVLAATSATIRLLSGQTSTSFSSSANIIGTAGLIGTTNLAYTSGGSLRAVGVLTGNVSSPVFTLEGSVFGANSIIGSSNLTFTLDADVLGTSNLIGTSSLTYTPEAILIASAVVPAGTSLSFVSVGLLTTYKYRSGSTSLFINVSADLGFSRLPYKTDDGINVQNLYDETSIDSSLLYDMTDGYNFNEIYESD